MRKRRNAGNLAFALVLLLAVLAVTHGRSWAAVGVTADDGGVSWHSVEESFGDDWWVYGIGYTSRLNERNSLYLDVERASGGSFTQPWRVCAGKQGRAIPALRRKVAS